MAATKAIEDSVDRVIDEADDDFDPNRTFSDVFIERSAAAQPEKRAVFSNDDSAGEKSKKSAGLKSSGVVIGGRESFAKPGSVTNGSSNKANDPIKKKKKLVRKNDDSSSSDLDGEDGSSNSGEWLPTIL